MKKSLLNLSALSILLGGTATAWAHPGHEVPVPGHIHAEAAALLVLCCVVAALVVASLFGTGRGDAGDPDAPKVDYRPSGGRS